MRSNRLAVAVAVVTVLSACAGPPPGPVDGRSTGSGPYEKTPDGSYRVRKGDSLYTIAFRFGLDWREIARINQVTAPYTIYPDQVLRLGLAAPPAAVTSPTPVADGSGVQIAAAPASRSSTTTALDSPTEPSTAVIPPGATASAQPESDSDLPQPATTPDRPSPAVTTPTAAVTGAQAPAGSTYTTPAGDPKRWLWPTDGRLLSTFKAGDSARKGIDIAGQPGQAVVASAAGQVVYSGSGLIGYGELVIIKHSDRMLSAYAHNSRRLVAEGQQVTAGSRIAEMGTNDRNQAVLHFEIRVNGVPEDPIRYLPQR